MFENLNLIFTWGEKNNQDHPSLKNTKIHQK